MAILTGTNDFAVEDIECGEQGRGAMAFVVVRLTLRQARSQRKDRCGAVQCLNLALLVYTQYQRAFGRIQIKPYDIPHLFLKTRIVGQLEPLHAMWLHVMALPDPVNDSPGNPELPRQHPHTPVCAAVAGTGLQRSLDDVLLEFRCQHTASALSLPSTGNEKDSIGSAPVEG